MSDDAPSMVLEALVRLEGNLAKVQDDLTSLRVDAMARLDRHENHLTSTRDDTGVAMGRGPDHIRRVNDSTREDVRGLSDRAKARQGMSRLWQASAGPDACGTQLTSKTFGTNEKAIAP